MTPLIILGCGYLGSRIATRALAAGARVRVCARSTGRLAPLGALGAEVRYVDVSTPKHLPNALAGMPGAAVVYAIPATTALPPGQAVRHAMQAAYGGNAESFIYFGTTGLYGPHPDDDVLIDETTPIVRDDQPMHDAIVAEEVIAASPFARLRTTLLRIAPVYGPGRGIRARMLKGDYRLLDDGQHAISRIYIDDLADIVFAAAERAPGGSIYMVGDDEPTTQREYATWLAERLGIPLPPTRAMFEPGAPRVHRNRRIVNTKLKTELALTLRYPTFRDGEAAIEAELAPS